MFKKGDIVCIDTHIASNEENWTDIGIVDDMKKIIKHITLGKLSNEFLVTGSMENLEYGISKEYCSLKHIKDSYGHWNWYGNMLYKKRKDIFIDDSDFTL